MRIQSKTFILIYWVIHLSQAISLSKLTSYAGSLIENLDAQRVKQILYCMKISRWIDSDHYSNVEYYFAKFDTDPLAYKFHDHLPENDRDGLRRRTEVISSIQSDLKLPPHIKRVAVAARKRAAK